MVEQVVVGVVVEQGTEEAVLLKGLVVEVQPGIDEGEVELVVVVVAVKHVKLCLVLCFSLTHSQRARLLKRRLGEGRVKRLRPIT